MTSRVFIVFSKGRTTHSMPLHNLEHCVCTTSKTKIKYGEDLVESGTFGLKTKAELNQSSGQRMGHGPTHGCICDH